MNMLSVGVSGHDESVPALGEAHRQFIAHFVGFFRRDLPRLKGLPYLVGDDIALLAAPCGLLVLPLGQKELLVHRQRAAPIAADQCLRVLGVISAAFQAGRNAFAFVLMQRDESCGCQFSHPLADLCPPDRSIKNKPRSLQGCRGSQDGQLRQNLFSQVN